MTGPRAPRVTALMTTMIQLAQTLDMTVTVEGIETEEQRRILTGLGCDHAQGFLLSRPLPPARAAALIPDASPAPS